MKINKFTCGLALGTFLGLIIAPDKGSRTRKRLAETATDIKDATISLKAQIEDLFRKGDSDLDALKAMLQDETKTLDNELRVQLIQLVDRSKKHYEAAKKTGDA